MEHNATILIYSTNNGIDRNITRNINIGIESD